MANFQNAFKLGLQASEEAAFARQEINAVLDEFAKQVREASQGSIKIERTTAPREIRALKTVYHLGLGTIPDYKTVPVLVASAADGQATPVHVLCDYELAPAGYPVVLRYADVVDHCRDRQSLELGLETLLAAPQTGDKLRQLLQFVKVPAPPDPAP